MQTSAECALEISCTRSTLGGNFWHRICTESCEGVQCGESSTEPSLCTTYEAASAGPSPTSVELPLHGVFQRWRDIFSGSSSGSKVLCFRDNQVPNVLLREASTGPSPTSVSRRLYEAGEFSARAYAAGQFSSRTRAMCGVSV